MRSAVAAADPELVRGLGVRALRRVGVGGAHRGVEPRAVVVEPVAARRGNLLGQAEEQARMRRAIWGVSAP